MKKTQTLLNYGIQIPHILLPETHIDQKKWAVIACDQYTQDHSYWKKVQETVGDSPSTLHITFPEIYLEDTLHKDRIAYIKNHMTSYSTSKTVFGTSFEGMIYLERTTSFGRTRKGLIATIDLEHYEWKKGSKALIRATEATIVERIPPRMEIRRNAPLELPHIMLLINDPENTVIKKPLSQTEQKPLYDTDLMCNSGHITGWAVDTEYEYARISQAFSDLVVQNTDTHGDSFLFAVGDGNHSLATAKAVWDEYKAAHCDDAQLAEHPARYALVEIVNLYDEGLTFEPIHRVLFHTEAHIVYEFLQQSFAKTQQTRLFDCSSAEELTNLVAQSQALKNVARFGFVFRDTAQDCRFVCLETGIDELAVSRLQPLLDDFLSTHTEVKIDYIHGNEEVFRLGNENKTLAILLPPIAKDNFFSTIAKGGALPRKSFSMGEADEKRFYFECRRLFE